jgi:hypothetical protein
VAIYHLSCKTISKSGSDKRGGTKNVSAAARARYIERKGEFREEGKPEEVMHSAAGNMPAWAENQHRYWIAADKYERSNGRLCKSMDIALPVELNLEQQISLAESFAAEITSTKDGKLPWHMTIHRGNGMNPHIHLMISERVNAGNHAQDKWFSRSGAKKTTALMPKAWLYEVRKQWEEVSNKALESAGIEVRIDARSLRERGIKRKPQKHRGTFQTHMNRLKSEFDELTEITQQTQTQEETQTEQDAIKLSLDKYSDEELLQIAKVQQQQIEQLQYLRQSRLRKMQTQNIPTADNAPKPR